MIVLLHVGADLPDIRSLSFSSEYDQFLFGLAMACPLPYFETGRGCILLDLKTIKKRQEELESYKFNVFVDNLELRNPLSIPSDQFGSRPDRCKIVHRNEPTKFTLHDGAYKEDVTVRRNTIALEKSDIKHLCFELDYNATVNGYPLAFSGYIYVQTGRFYPKEVQGLLVRLRNVAIGAYDINVMTYPYAEGPRFSMLSAELFVDEGMDDALNIDRDSFNALDPHYVRIQSFIHCLLHSIIFPEAWTEEKGRNLERRQRKQRESQHNFVKKLESVSHLNVRKISISEIRRERDVPPPKPNDSPVAYNQKEASIEIDRNHPLLKQMFAKRKNSQLASQIVVAFEKANQESSPERRRDVFYRLIANIFEAI